MNTFYFWFFLSVALVSFAFFVTYLFGRMRDKDKLIKYTNDQLQRSLSENRKLLPARPFLDSDVCDACGSSSYSLGDIAYDGSTYTGSAKLRHRCNSCGYVWRTAFKTPRKPLDAA